MEREFDESPFAGQSGVSSPPPDASRFEPTNFLEFSPDLIAEQLTKIETVSPPYIFNPDCGNRHIRIVNPTFLLFLHCVNDLLGAVCAPGPLPLPGFTVVPEGQEREGRRLLVRPRHHPPV